MRQQNSDDISSEMLRIMGSDEHTKLFGLKKKAQTVEMEYYDDPEKAKERNESLITGAPPGVVANPTTPVAALPGVSVESALQSAMSGFDPGAKAAAQAVMSGNLPEGAVDKLAPFFKGMSGVEVQTALGNFINSKSAPVTAKSAIVDLVKIAEFLAAKGLHNEEAIADKLIESIALESRKALRKQAEGMLSVVAEDIFGTLAEDKDSDDDDDDDDDDDATDTDDSSKGNLEDDEDDDEEGKAGNKDEDDEADKGKAGTDDNDKPVEDFEKAMLEDSDLGESSIVPY